MIYTLIDITGDTLDIESEILEKIPYFEAMLAVKDVMETQVNGNRINLENYIKVLYLKCIMKYIQDQTDVLLFVSCVPATLTNMLSEIIEMIELLGIPLDTSFEEYENIHMLLTAFKSSYNADSRAEQKIARETAAKLIIQMVKGENIRDPKELSKLYNSVLFIVSHSATFRPRMRYHMYHVARNKCNFSMKQWIQIESWYKPDELGEDEDDDDDSDEGESYCYCSDDDDYD